MKGLIFFLATFLLVRPLWASDSTCQKGLNADNFVHIRYNYGILNFDASKSTYEVSQICKDKAAGCFSGSFGAHTISVGDKNYQLRSERCVAPDVDVVYDFSGSVIFVTNEYSSCRARAVFRHELQHFLVWKTSIEWFLKDLRYSLKEAVRKQAKSCPKVGICTTRNSQKILHNALYQVQSRWQKIELQNQDYLDQIDHSDVDEVNYTVCTPYSLEVSLF